MKDLIKQYLDQGLSRRQLVSGLSALGMSTVAAKAMAQNLTPAAQSAAPAAEAAPAAIREVEGNGGRLFVEQLKAAGVEHIFFNPSTGDHPIFDALVDEPGRSISSRACRKAPWSPWPTAMRAPRATPASSSSPISACPTP